MDSQHELNQATLEFSMGNHEEAIKLLNEFLAKHPQHADALHTLSEIYLADKQLGLALSYGLQALEQNPEDIHTHTTLSRIYVAQQEIQKAEEHNAKARMLGWKDQLQNPDTDPGLQL